MSKARVFASCQCGAIQWAAPIPSEHQMCSCGACEASGADWSACEPGEFEILAMDVCVTGHQNGAFSPRHYCCSKCGSQLLTWTPDVRRSLNECPVSDYENPILNWNAAMQIPDVGPVSFATAGRNHVDQPLGME